MYAYPQKYQIVLAAFGTSMGPKAAYTSMQVRFQERFRQRIPVGFTSRVGEPKLKEVLEGLPADGELVVVIAPIFMVEGQVVKRDIVATAKECEHRFKEIRVARPLLPDARVYSAVKREVASRLKNVPPGGTGIIFVGHGTPDEKAAEIYGECARQVASLFASPFKAAFGNRRKTLWNCLKGQFASDDCLLRLALDSCGIDCGRRGETLSLEEFATLSRALQT